MRVAMLLCLLVAFSGSAAEHPLTRDVLATLSRAAHGFRGISTHGGYLWRYSPDLKQRFGEGKASETEIWVQPPGTPAVGQAFLRAYEVTKEKQYLEAARAAAHALVYGQLDSGGWDYRIDFDPKGAERYLRRADAAKLRPEQRQRRRNNTVFDDDNTQSAVRFLLAYLKAAEGAPDAKDGEIRDAVDYALKGILKAQYPNGAWPQVYMGQERNPADYPILRAQLVRDHQNLPRVKEYWHFYTFNDHAMRQTIVTLLAAHEQLQRPEYLEAVKRCGDFILRAQLPEPQPAWAQQYDFQMRPSWARKFEPASVCSSESVGIIRLLVDLHLRTGEQKYLEPIPRALAWLKRSEIAPGRWARFYEMGTNKPLYFTKAYELTYSDADMPTHYSFQGDYGVNSVVRYYEEVQKVGREGYLRGQAPKTAAPAEQMRRLAGMEARVREVIGSLDAKGRWTTDNQIECSTFIRNVEVLCDWVELAGE